MKVSQKELDLAIADLAKGEDYNARNILANQMSRIITASEYGEIGLGDFVEDLKAIVECGDLLLNQPWSVQSHD